MASLNFIVDNDNAVKSLLNEASKVEEDTLSELNNSDFNFYCDIYIKVLKEICDDGGTVDSTNIKNDASVIAVNVPRVKNASEIKPTEPALSSTSNKLKVPSWATNITDFVKTSRYIFGRTRYIRKAYNMFRSDVHAQQHLKYAKNFDQLIIELDTTIPNLYKYPITKPKYKGSAFHLTEFISVEMKSSDVVDNALHSIVGSGRDISTGYANRKPLRKLRMIKGTSSTTRSKSTHHKDDGYKNEKKLEGSTEKQQSSSTKRKNESNSPKLWKQLNTKNNLIDKNNSKEQNYNESYSSRKLNLPNHYVAVSALRNIINDSEKKNSNKVSEKQYSDKKISKNLSSLTRNLTNISLEEDHLNMSNLSNPGINVDVINDQSPISCDKNAVPSNRKYLSNSTIKSKVLNCNIKPNKRFYTTGAEDFGNILKTRSVEPFYSNHELDYVIRSNCAEDSFYYVDDVLSLSNENDKTCLKKDPLLKGEQVLVKEIFNELENTVTPFKENDVEFALDLHHSKICSQCSLKYDSQLLDQELSQSTNIEFPFTQVDNDTIVDNRKRQSEKDSFPGSDFCSPKNDGFILNYNADSLVPDINLAKVEVGNAHIFVNENLENTYQHSWVPEIPATDASPVLEFKNVDAENESNNFVLSTSDKLIFDNTTGLADTNSFNSTKGITKDQTDNDTQSSNSLNDNDLLPCKSLPEENISLTIKIDKSCENQNSDKSSNISAEKNTNGMENCEQRFEEISAKVDNIGHESAIEDPTATNIIEVRVGFDTSTPFTEARSSENSNLVPTIKMVGLLETDKDTHLEQRFEETSAKVDNIGHKNAIEDPTATNIIEVQVGFNTSTPSTELRSSENANLVPTLKMVGLLKTDKLEMSNTNKCKRKETTCSTVTASHLPKRLRTNCTRSATEKNNKICRSRSPDNPTTCKKFKFAVDNPQVGFQFSHNKKVGYDFSTYKDAQEIADNTDPRWLMYKLNTFEACFNSVCEQWNFQILPNPHKDLTLRFNNRPLICNNFPVDTWNNDINCLQIYDDKMHAIQTEINLLKCDLELFAGFWNNLTISRSKRKIIELENQMHLLECARNESDRLYQLFYNRGYNAEYIGFDKMREAQHSRMIVESNLNFYGNSQ